MAQINLYIDFRKYTSHVQLTADLAPAFDATLSDNVYLKININAYSLLYSDFLLLVSTTIIYLRDSGITVNGTFENFLAHSDRTQYASRINFFHHIKFAFNENFIRHPGAGRFTEIKRFIETKNSEEFYLNLHSEILRILYQRVSVSQQMLEVLDFCLSEIMDNALRHSGVEHGWASAQYFPTRKEIRIIVCDSGMGIHQSLTTPEASQYKNLSESQALVRSIEKGVTSGTGLGNGLFYTSEFIKANAGQMLLYSGNHYLTCNANDTIVMPGPKWKGTFVFFKINTDVAVNYNDFFSDNSELEWLMDQNFGVDDNLW